MRISDWSSDVCSSDLAATSSATGVVRPAGKVCAAAGEAIAAAIANQAALVIERRRNERARVCQRICQSLCARRLSHTHENATRFPGYGRPVHLCDEESDQDLHGREQARYQ